MIQIGLRRYAVGNNNDLNICPLCSTNIPVNKITGTLYFIKCKYSFVGLMKDPQTGISKRINST